MNFKTQGILRLLANFPKLSSPVSTLFYCAASLVAETLHLNALDNFLAKHPLHLGLIITSRCNRNCPHCIVGNILNRSANKMDMTLDDVKDIMERRYLKSIIRVAIGGGEPLIHKEVSSIVNYLSHKGVLVNVTTNGDLLTAKIVQDLLDAGAWLITISYYKDNGAKIRSLMEELPPAQRAKIALHYHSTQIKDYREAYQFASTVGIRHLMFDHTHIENDPREDAVRNLFAEEFNAMCEQIRKDRLLYLYASSPFIEKPNKQGCAIIRSHYAFVPGGIIKPCCYIKADPKFGDIENPEPFMLLKENVRLGIKAPNECKTCHIFGGKYM